MARKSTNVARDNARDAILAQAVGRVLVTPENARDPDANHPARRGLGDLPGIRKDARGNVLVQEVQADTSTVPASELIMNRDDQKLAHDILSEFKGAGSKLQTLKEKLDAARGGLSDIMFRLATRAAERMDAHPQWRMAMFDKFCLYVESEAVKDFKKATNWHAQPGAKEPKVKDAISPSWATYRGQIRRGLKAGYDPRQFASSTPFRTAAQDAERANRTPRTPAGDVANAAAGVDDPMVAGVLVKLTEIAAMVPEDKRNEAADIISAAMHQLQVLAGTVSQRSRRTRAGRKTATTPAATAEERTAA